MIPARVGTTERTAQERPLILRMTFINDAVVTQHDGSSSRHSSVYRYYLEDRLQEKELAET